MTPVEFQRLWFDEVSGEWTLSRIRNVATLSPGNSKLPVSLDEPCTIVPMERISEYGTIDVSEQQVLKELQQGLTPFEQGDVLFAKITPCMENGKGALVSHLPTRQGFGSTEFHVLRPSHRVNGKFLYYATFNPVFRSYAAENMTGAAGQKRVSSQFLKDSRLPLPPISEQKLIAAYLDASCAALDAAVAIKRGQLEILDGFAVAVVHQAVTRGLKRIVALKPSGMDWLPEVPGSWRVQQIKRACEIVRGKFTHRPRNDPAFYDGDYPFVQTGDISAARKYIRSYSQTLNELGLSASKMFPRSTLVMSIAANIGDVAILDFEACFPDSIVGLIPGPGTNMDFLYYLIRAMKGIMLRSAVLSTQLNLNYVRIGANFAAFPPKKEQEEIAAFLDEKEEELHTVRTSIEAQITTLLAYRKSLIHECVTGQRRVTEADLARVQREKLTGAALP